MRLHSLSACVALLCAGLVSCSGSDSSSANTGSTYEFQTTTFTVPAGEEHYMCYAVTLDHDMQVNQFDYKSHQVVHHFLFARTTVPEPEGMAECNVLFRTSWVPLFGAGASNAHLSLPSDTAYTFHKGDQLMVQLHLLNTTQKDITDSVGIKLGVTNQPDAKSVGVYAFGTTDIALPPASKHDVVNECTVDSDVNVFAVLPHMHYLGNTLKFEVADANGNYQEVYRRSPWSFDDQFVDDHPLQLKAGTKTRITCSYDNNTAKEVDFGESSHDEMCFLVTFARDRTGLDGCVKMPDAPSDGGVPPNPDAGACGDQKANSMGIGQACTAGGNECPGGLTCSADQDGSPPGTTGFCLKVGGCQVSADCGGGGATCCSPAQAGGLINICMPEACRPSDCTPK